MTRHRTDVFCQKDKINKICDQHKNSIKENGVIRKKYSLINTSIPKTSFDKEIDNVKNEYLSNYSR